MCVCKPGKMDAVGADFGKKKGWESAVLGRSLADEGVEVCAIYK